MARKKAIPIRDTLVPDPRHLVHLWRHGDRLCYLSEAPQCGGYTRAPTIDVARPFRYHVPGNGKGKPGLVFEGMTGVNAEPWTPSQVLSAARFGLFGFKLDAP